MKQYMKSQERPNNNYNTPAADGISLNFIDSTGVEPTELSEVAGNSVVFQELLWVAAPATFTRWKAGVKSEVV